MPCNKIDQLHLVSDQNIQLVLCKEDDIVVICLDMYEQVNPGSLIASPEKPLTELDQR